jgi:hypothetical protein
LHLSIGKNALAKLNKLGANATAAAMGVTAAVFAHEVGNPQRHLDDRADATAVPTSRTTFLLTPRGVAA